MYSARGVFVCALLACWPPFPLLSQSPVPSNPKPPTPSSLPPLPRTKNHQLTHTQQQGTSTRAKRRPRRCTCASPTKSRRIPKSRRRVKSSFRDFASFCVFLSRPWSSIVCLFVFCSFINTHTPYNPPSSPSPLIHTHTKQTNKQTLKTENPTQAAAAAHLRAGGAGGAGSDTCLGAEAAAGVVLI